MSRQVPVPTTPEDPPAAARVLNRARRVAIVSDGSARWAQAHGLSIGEGHEAAATTVVERIADAIELGVQQLTLYAFSTENWARPQDEVQALLAMLARRISADTPQLRDRGVRVRFTGRRDRAGAALAGAMDDAERVTQGNRGMGVYVAFDYGGRDEIVSAAARYRGGGEAQFARLMHAPDMHDPDLVIRTGGERRLSNFLLWQAAYSELVFRDEMWPDFRREAFAQSLADYATRERRFGARDAGRGADAVALVGAATASARALRRG
jgi:undecaprenyl diphosphate synthase